MSKPKMKNEILDRINAHFIETYQLLIERSEKKISLTRFNKSLSDIYMLKQKKDKEVTNKINVVLVTGSFGSGKKKFAEFLTKILKKTQDHQVELFSPSNTQMNEMQNSRHYVRNLANFVKEKRTSKTLTKNSMIVAIVPSSLPIDHLFNSFYTSKIKNFLEIISVCSKINLNNIYQNDMFEIVDNLFTYC